MSREGTLKKCAMFLIWNYVSIDKSIDCILFFEEFIYLIDRFFDLNMELTIQ